MSRRFSQVVKRVRVKEPKEIPCDNLRNPADPDSSYNKHRGQGYLGQVMETYQEDDEAPDDQEADATADERPHLAEQSPAFKERYRWRAGVEATMSRLKHQMRLAHLRVRGMKAVTYATLLRTLGLNIRRCDRCLTA